MRIIKKAVISLLITTILFTAFTFFSYTTLFDLIETNFFNRKIINQIENKLLSVENAFDQYKKERLSIALNLSEEAAVKNSFLINQSREDIFKRNNLIEVLKNNYIYFDYIRIVDDEGKIHFSNNNRDINTADETKISYKRFDDTQSTYSLEQLFEILKKSNFVYDSVEEKIIFFSNIKDNFGITRGEILVYFSEDDVYKYLLAENIIESSSTVNFAGNTGLVVNLFEKTEANLSKIEQYWNSGDIENPKPLFISATGDEYSIITRKTPAGFISYLLLTSSLLINAYYKIIILVSAFIIIMVFTFLLFNLRQDKITLVADRIKRFQINLLIEYLDQKNTIEWKKWKKELESRKEEARKEFKRGIRGIKGDKERLINELIDKSWDEVISILSGHLEKRTHEQNAVANINIGNIEEIIRSVILKERELQPAVKTIPAVKIEAETTYDTKSETESAVEELEDLEELDELEDAEVHEAAEAVEELEELDELEDAEVHEAAEAVEQPEELEELDELEDAEANEGEENEKIYSSNASESEKFKELISTFKDYGEEIISIDEVINAFKDIEKNVIPVDDGEDEIDLKKLDGFINYINNKDARIEHGEYRDDSDVGELEEILELDDEVEELDEKIVELDEEILELDHEVEELDVEILELDEEIEELEPVSLSENIVELPLIPEEKLEYLEKVEKEIDASEETVEYISSKFMESFLKSNYTAESLFDDIRKKRKEELAGLDGSSCLEEVIDSDLKNDSELNFKDKLKKLEKNNLIEILTVKELSRVFNPEDSFVVENDGILEIREDLYSGMGDTKNTLNRLIDNSEDKNENINFSNFADFIIGDDIDLPVFSDIKKTNNENIDIEVVSEDNYFDKDHGLDYDYLIEKSKGDRNIASMKTLLKITRDIGSLYGALLTVNEKGCYPEISVGLDDEKNDLLEFNENEEIFNEIIVKNKILYLKTKMDSIDDLQSKFSKNDYIKLKSCLLMPIKYNNTKAYLIASPDPDKFTLKDFLLKVKNLQK